MNKHESGIYTYIEYLNYLIYALDISWRGLLLKGLIRNFNFDNCSQKFVQYSKQYSEMSMLQIYYFMFLQVENIGCKSGRGSKVLSG